MATSSTMSPTPLNETRYSPKNIYKKIKTMQLLLYNEQSWTHLNNGQLLEPKKNMVKLTPVDTLYYTLSKDHGHFSDNVMGGKA
jgi:hypothetical protein